jgi:RNA polymerase sigma-70 factor, ECF subfamily
MTHDDATLAESLALDLDGSFERLVRAYQDRLFGFALRLTGCSADAEEAVQDAFVRAYRALHRYPSQQRQSLQLRAWLYRITLNVVRNRVRTPRLSLRPLDGTIQVVAEAPGEQPESAALAAERRRDLAELVAQLPERYRAAVVLRHVQGLAYAEVAEVLRQPVGTTKANVHRGLRLLRQALAEDTRDELLMGDTIA